MTLSIKKKAKIQTERLTIRPYTIDDTKELVNLLTNPDIAKTFMVPEFESPEQAEALVKKLITFSKIDDVTHLEYGIYLDDKMIGFVNDCGVEEEEIEIGYVIHPHYQGNGYATEAVQAIICELHEMGFYKITAGFFEENVASQRVLEKCGMQLSGETEQEEYRGKCHICHYCELNL